VQSIRLSFLPYLQELESAQLQKPASKTFIRSPAATPKLIYRHSLPARARSCGATSQKVWSALLKKNVPLLLCPNLLHPRQLPRFPLALFFRFSRSFVIFNPALDLLLATARRLLPLKAMLLLLTRIRRRSRLACVCLSSTPAAILYLLSMRSR